MFLYIYIYIYVYDHMYIYIYICMIVRHVCMFYQDITSAEANKMHGATSGR